MRHASLLHALAKALFTGLFLGSGFISIAYAANADDALAVSVDDFKYRDTRAFLLRTKLSDRRTGIARSAARGVTGRRADPDHRRLS